MQPSSHFDEFFIGNAYGFRELTLAEMLYDPIVEDLMRSDGVSPSDVKKIFSWRRVRNIVLAA
jgi:hypothetical protein